MDFYEIWYAISQYAVVDAQPFQKILCLLFQTVFNHFRPEIQQKVDIWLEYIFLSISCHIFHA